MVRLELILSGYRSYSKRKIFELESAIEVKGLIIRTVTKRFSK